MTKICIIAPASRSYLPYLEYYEYILNNAEIPYDVYYWDRFHINEENIKSKSFICNSSVHGLGSIHGYFGYRRFLLNKMQVKKYHLYIVLSVQVGVLIYDFLCSKKFILDIRDFSHENKCIYRFLANRLIKKAKIVVISSDGFRSWLPASRKYLLSHNVGLESFQNIDMPIRLDPNKLIVSYIGGVSYYEANIHVINVVSRNDKLVLRYIGSGTCEKELAQYCTDNEIRNVEFYGRYLPTQKLSFYKETDFVLSCYGNNNEIVRSSTPNRLYESCILRKPIIVNTGTHLAKLVKEYGIGIVVDLENMDDLYEKLLTYSDPETYNCYIQACNRYIEIVRNDVSVFRSSIKDILEDI